MSANLLVRDRETERDLWTDLCCQSFWHFLNYGFGVANYMRHHPENRWLTERIHRPLCEWLESYGLYWLERRTQRKTPLKLMIVWPRGFGKTTVVTKAFQLWLHLRDPDLSTMISSVTTAKSWDFLKTLKDVISGADPNAWFTQLYGNWYRADRPWRAGYLVHARRRSIAKSEASFETTSVEQGLTGKHPDAIFIDDPVTQEKLVEGGNWHEKVHAHTNALIPALQANGLLVAAATRYSDDDWLGRYMREEGVRELAGLIPNDPQFETKPVGQWNLYFMQARLPTGDPTLPEVHGEESLRNYELKSPMDFAAQMMNEPGTGEHMPITREQIEHMWVSPKDVPGNLRISVHCDTAWKSREKLGRGDFNVIQVWGHAADGSGEVYYLEGHRSNAWRVEDFGDRLVMVLQRLKKEGRRPFVLTDEQSLGGKAGALDSLVQSWCAQAGMFAPPVTLLNRGGTKKELRIREAAAYWADGKVRLVRGAPEVEHLVSEMCRIGVSAHDDMADAAADVFHQEIYTPERVLGKEPRSPIPRRPMDVELQLDSRAWSDETVREVYDEVVERELVRWGDGW